MTGAVRLCPSYRLETTVFSEYKHVGPRRLVGMIAANLWQTVRQCVMRLIRREPQPFGRALVRRAAWAYDVPVKLYSLNLLLLSMFLILPDTSRLFQIFVLNASAQPSNLRELVLSHNSVRRTVLVLKFTVLAIFLVRTVASSVSRYREVEAQTAPSAYPLTTRGFHWIQEEPYNR
jgi:hypothetical protein